jgi:hypothetical protein
MLERIYFRRCMSWSRAMEAAVPVDLEAGKLFQGHSA